MNKYVFEVYVGENGNWFINGTDTGAKAQGENGITPHIGNNGNWFVGDVDTGIAAQGPQGIPGPVNIANNLTTDNEGYALDARQGIIIQDKINEINSKIIGVGNFHSLYQTVAPCTIQVNVTAYRKIGVVFSYNDSRRWIETIDVQTALYSSNKHTIEFHKSDGMTCNAVFIMSVDTNSIGINYWKFNGWVFNHAEIFGIS